MLRPEAWRLFPGAGGGEPHPWQRPAAALGWRISLPPAAAPRSPRQAAPKPRVQTFPSFSTNMVRLGWVSDLPLEHGCACSKLVGAEEWALAV